VSRDSLYTSGVAVPLLLFLGALSVALQLYEAGWAPGLGMLPWLVVISVALALVLTRSILPSWVLHLSSGAIGFVLTLFGVAHYAIHGAEIGESVHEVLYRLGEWFAAVTQSQATNDSLPFSILLGLSLWLTYHLTVWLIYRMGKVWWAVVAPAIALVVSVYYAPGTGSGYVALYAFTSLLLVIRVSLHSLTRGWRLARIRHDRMLGDEFLFDALHVVALLVIVAWLLPPLALEQKAATLWTRFEHLGRAFQHRWSEMFPTTAKAGRPATLVSVHGESLVLGGPVQLSSEPLFEVRMPLRSRMQSMAFDLYDGRQWWPSASRAALLDPDEFPQIELYRKREWLEQHVTVLSPTRVILAAPQPRWFSVSAKIEYVPVDVVAGERPLDIYGATAGETLGPGDSYKSLSSVSRATESMLRSAEQENASVPEVYTRIPSSIPRRVVELAKQITEGLNNDYDRAEALEAYLRTLEYNENVGPPPPDRDPIDYFLFDSRAGYCNYFASAMVVMARSLGIPARIAAGYAPGEYDPEAEAFVIRGSDAHSWPQLYFSGYGWIDFEPTPGEPLVTRAASGAEGSARPVEPGYLDDMRDEELELFGSGTQGAVVPTAARAPVGVISMLIAMGGLVFGSYCLLWVLPRKIWRPEERVYVQLIALARLLGVRARDHETPKELGNRIAARLPHALDGVATIVQGFYDVRYRPGDWPQNGQHEVRLAEAWRQVIRAARDDFVHRLARANGGQG